MGRLAAAVHLRHPVTHERLILEPGDEPDAEVAEAITNPGAWEPEGEPDDHDQEQPEPGAKTPARKPSARPKTDS